MTVSRFFMQPVLQPVAQPFVTRCALAGACALFAGSAAGQLAIEGPDFGDTLFDTIVLDPGFSGLRGTLLAREIAGTEFSATRTLVPGETVVIQLPEALGPFQSYFAFIDNAASGIDTLLAGEFGAPDDDSSIMGNGLASGIISQANVFGDIVLTVTGVGDFDFDGIGHSEAGEFTLYIETDDQATVDRSDVDFIRFTNLAPERFYNVGLFDTNLNARLGLVDAAGVLLGAFNGADANLTFESDFSGGATVIVSGAGDTNFLGAHNQIGNYSIDIFEVCVPDFAVPNGVLNKDDIDEVLLQLTQALPSTDITLPNGTVDFFDLARFMNFAAEGCAVN